MAQGDIHALQGKWMLQEEEGDGRLPDHTLVKLAVEVKFRRSVRSMLFEPFIEVRRSARSAHVASGSFA